MTETPLTPKKWLKYPLQHEKWPKYPWSLKKTRIPLKPKKRPKLIKCNLIILENDLNTPKTKERPTYPKHLKNDQSTPTTQRMAEILPKHEKN